MSASDHLNGHQFPRMPIDEVMKLPSIDAITHREGDRTVAAEMPYKERDMSEGWEVEHYARLKDRMADHGVETPVHIFTAGHKAYGTPIPEEFRGRQVFGNGHHRVAMARQLGIKDIPYTPDKQKSATKEDL